MAKRSRFIVPDTERLNLSDEDYIEVKSDLAWGESLLLNTSLNDALNQNGATPVHEGLKDYYLLRAALWITDWSFTDAKGNPVPWDDGQERSMLEELLHRRELLASLDGVTGAEINTALNAHEERVRGKVQPTGSETTETTAETTPTDQPPPKAAKGAPTSP